MYNPRSYTFPPQYQSPGLYQREYRDYASPHAKACCPFHSPLRSRSLLRAVGTRDQRNKPDSDSCTLNADRNANRKRNCTVQLPSSRRELQKPGQTIEVVSHNRQKGITQGGPSNDAIARPISSPSPWFSGCRRLAWKGWDRGRDSSLQGHINPVLGDAIGRSGRHRKRCRRRRDGPGTWLNFGIAQEIGGSITSVPFGRRKRTLQTPRLVFLIADLV